MYCNGLSEDGNTITLNKFAGCFDFAKKYSEDWFSTNQANLCTGLVVDTETTGFDSETDKIIEIGLREFVFDKKTGHIVKIGESYSELQDPEEPLSEDVQKVTKLNNELLKGKKIDWERVSQFFERADIVIAHNAAFDRNFVERSVKISGDKVWACSCNQIDWLAKGFVGRGLVLLGNFHGFFYESHRALSDVDALLNLLRMEDKTTGLPYLNELLEEARTPLVQVIASNSPFERKDLLKKRGYKWNVASRVWSRIIKEANKDDEIKWLEDAVYLKPFAGTLLPLRRCDNFKRVG